MTKKSNAFQGKVYVVEDILDTKLINGIQHYKVKWKGYSFSECTWEPEESFNCSKQILNQFLMTRVEKQPSFLEKLLKIFKEKDPDTKLKENKQNFSIEKKLIHSEKKDFSEKHDKEPEVNNKQSESNSEENDSNVKYGYKFEAKSKAESKSAEDQEPNLGKEKSSPSIKEECNQKIKIKKVKILHQSLPQIQTQPQSKTPPLQQCIPLQDSKPIQQSAEKVTQGGISEKKEDIQNNQTKPKVHHPFKIVRIKKINKGLQFTVIQEGQKRIKTKQEMHHKYPVQLCEYYEKFISFDQ